MNGTRDERAWDQGPGVKAAHSRRFPPTHSHVHLQPSLHAIRVDDPAPQLHPPGLPRRQRDGTAEPAAAVVWGAGALKGPTEGMEV